MRKESISGESESRPAYADLDDWMRVRMQELLQNVLEGEVTDFPGRAKSARRSVADTENGYARPNRLTTTSGTITVQRPRVRDTEEWIVSRLLPPLKRRTRDAMGRGRRAGGRVAAHGG